MTKELPGSSGGFLLPAIFIYIYLADFEPPAEDYRWLSKLVRTLRNLEVMRNGIQIVLLNS